MKDYFLSFVAIFVAMDVVGTLPVFMAMTEGLDRRERRAVVAQAVLAGAAVGVLFMFGGERLFRVLGVTIADFRVAGGLILLVFAIHDLLFSRAERRRSDAASLGVVPIGIPLLVGPAVLTGLLLSYDRHGAVPTLASLAANLAIAFLVFLFGDLVTRVLGEGGARGVGKVASLLLAALAVMMIRSGMQQMLAGGTG
jgi:multiple antibiotic resistance protein